MAYPHNQARLYNPASMRLERGAYRHPAHSDTMKALLGIPGKLPAEGMDPVYIQGVKVWIETLETAKWCKEFHRVKCECPACGKVMSAGRLNQHTCKA